MGRRLALLLSTGIICLVGAQAAAAGALRPVGTAVALGSPDSYTIIIP